MTNRYRLTALAAAAVMAFSFAGCGGKTSDSGASASSKLEEQEQLTSTELIYRVEENGHCHDLNEKVFFESDVFKSNCEKLYGEPAESFSDGAIMFVSSGETADEISVLKSDSADCEKLLEERKQRRYKDFEGYAPGELDKIENAEIFEVGGLWVLIISDGAEELKALACGE